MEPPHLAELVPEELELLRRLDLAVAAEEVHHLAVHEGRGVRSGRGHFAQRRTDHALEALAIGRSVGADRRHGVASIQEDESTIAPRALWLAAEGGERGEDLVA